MTSRTMRCLMDHTAVLAGPPAAAGLNFPTDFVRPSGVDLPSLAESVRSVEERIARQNAEYEALTRAYERLRDTEAAATARADALAADLASARTALESEHGRSRDLERMLADRSSAVESSRSRVEEALRESERHQGESQTLKDSLAARDATIAQVLHSLGERDAQLAALQAEHAKIVPALEATSKSSTQLDADLRTARAQADARAAELQASRAGAGCAQCAARARRVGTAGCALRAGRRQDAGEFLSRTVADPRVAPRVRPESVPRIGCAGRRRAMRDTARSNPNAIACKRK